MGKRAVAIVNVIANAITIAKAYAIAKADIYAYVNANVHINVKAIANANADAIAEAINYTRELEELKIFNNVNMYCHNLDINIHRPVLLQSLLCLVFILFLTSNSG